MSSLLIIGGSDAGISAALRAQEVDPAARVTIVLADAFPNYSICGLPFFLSGETPDWKQLAHRTEFPGIEPLTEHRATRIDPDTRTVQVAHRGRERRLAYERLVVGAGAVPVRPPIDGLDQPGVYLLHTMEDSFRVHEHLTQRVAPRRAVIIGAGYIGLEMADALTHRGLTVTVASRPAEVLPTVDPELGRHVRAELVRRGVEVRTGVEVRSIERAGSSGELSVRGPGGFEAAADLVLVAVGVRPDSKLARSAGVETDRRGAIRVNRAMETNVANIYAAGDCVETWHRLLEKTTYLPLGTTSRKQGRVAGENAVGGRAWFAGSVGTQVVKIFELAIGRTGLLPRRGARGRLRAADGREHLLGPQGLLPGRARVARARDG